MKRTFLLAFETSTPRRDILEDYLRRLPWWHFFSGFHLVQTELSAEELSNEVRKFLHESNPIFVVEVNVEHFSGCLRSEAWEWLRKRAAEQVAEAPVAPKEGSG